MRTSILLVQQAQFLLTYGQSAYFRVASDKSPIIARKDLLRLDESLNGGALQQFQKAKLLGQNTFPFVLEDARVVIHVTQAFSSSSLGTRGRPIIR